MEPTVVTGVPVALKAMAVTKAVAMMAVPVVLKAMAVTKAVAMKAMPEMAESVAKEEWAVVAKAVMPTGKSFVPVQGSPVTIETLPVRENPVVAMGPDPVMT